MKLYKFIIPVRATTEDGKIVIGSIWKTFTKPFIGKDFDKNRSGKIFSIKTYQGNETFLNTIVMMKFIMSALSPYMKK